VGPRWRCAGGVFALLLAIGGLAAPRPELSDAAESAGVVDFIVSSARVGTAAPASNALGNIDSIRPISNDVLLIEGWAAWGTHPPSISLAPGLVEVNGEGFAYARADLPPGVGARAFSLIVKGRGVSELGVCLWVITGGTTGRLTSAACP